jgi:radical SAM protein with 4Fe4S-binding SPASM domain
VKLRRQDSLIFEITQRCNHDCPHCYNAWKNDQPYPMGELGTADTIALLGKALYETGAAHVTLSGGEPLLRRDIYAIVDFLKARGIVINLISNGALLTAETIAPFLPDKISIFELPLLSCERAIHDRMSGSPGAFDRTTLAMAELKATGQRVVGVFVATKLNLPQWRETAELAFALGLDGIMFNRFNPGGEGYKNLELLQSSPADLQQALDIAEAVAEEYQMPISCSIPMPPCLFKTEQYKRLGFGFCAAGTARAYYTIDPLGNLRPCNHSNTILGNIRERNFWDMVDSAAMREFVAASPEFCSGCRMEKTCLGGCKAAAQVCFGGACAMDPFLAAFQGQARKK